jgi:hypothetical protein
VLAFQLPFGAPGEGPPCIRHLPFAIAGGWHGFPLRVRAPHRLARCMCNCMGLILRFGPHPTPLHVADNGLAALVNVDVFDGDLLLTLTAMPVQRFEQRSVSARKFIKVPSRGW